MRSMFVQVPMQTGCGSVRRVEVSVPYVAALVADDAGKYYMERKRLDDDTERRRYRARGPTLRSLVKLALQCQSAEELGQLLKARRSPAPDCHRPAAAATLARSRRGSTSYSRID